LTTHDLTNLNAQVDRERLLLEDVRLLPEDVRRDYLTEEGLIGG